MTARECEKCLIRRLFLTLGFRIQTVTGHFPLSWFRDHFACPTGSNWISFNDSWIVLSRFIRSQHWRDRFSREGRTYCHRPCFPPQEVEQSTFPSC